MPKIIQLLRTPIKEIIFTISFNETVDILSLDKFINLPKIKSEFTNTALGFHADIQEKEGQEPETNLTRDGYILKTDKNKNRILQVMRGSFAFHKVNEYEKFELLLGEFRNYWTDFVTCVGRLTVNRISVRYLNFIEKDLEESNNELINIYPNHPFLSKTTGFINLKFPVISNIHISTNIIVADVVDNNSKNGIVLDIKLNRTLDNENDVEKIFSFISEMRAIKNELFFECITEKTIKKYNQK